MIENEGTRVLIDPSGHEKDKLGNFGQLDAVLYTHEHGDHFDAGMAQTFVEQGIAPVYANAGTSKLIKASKTTVHDGKEYKIGKLTVKAIGLPHCLMVDGSEGPQNTGYLINGKIFHPGDGKELAGLKVEVLAMPLAGPDISPHDAFMFAKQVHAGAVVPIHYDYLGGNPAFFASTAEKAGIKTHALKYGESVEL